MTLLIIGLILWSMWYKLDIHVAVLTRANKVHKKIPKLLWTASLMNLTPLKAWSELGLGHIIPLTVIPI